MNKTYLSLLCAGAVLVGTGYVFADEDMMAPPPPPHEEIGHPAQHNRLERGPKMRGPERLDEELKLTDEQKAQAKKIREEGREKVKPLFEEMKQIREKMDKLREENMKEFENILTPEQKAQLEKIKARHHGERNHERKGPHHERKKKGGGFHK